MPQFLLWSQRTQGQGERGRPAGPGRARPAGLRARLGFPVSSLRCLCFNSKGLSGTGDPVEPPGGPTPQPVLPKAVHRHRAAGCTGSAPSLNGDTAEIFLLCPRSSLPEEMDSPLPQSVSDSQGAPSELIMLCCIKPIS